MAVARILTFVKAISIWLLFQGLLLAAVPIAAGLPGWWLAISVGGLLSAIMLFVTWLYLRSDPLDWSDLGMTFARWSVPRFVLSLIVGLAFFGCFYLIFLGFAPVIVVPIDQVDVVRVALLAFAAMLALGTMEEVVFRGYFLKKLDRAVGVRPAIYLTSIAFGQYHGWNLSSVNPAIWGLLYAVLAYWSKGLAVPLGFHVGVNLIQALFNQKTKWVVGLWDLGLTEQATLLTIPQVALVLQVALLVLGVLSVEYYLRRVHPSRAAGNLPA